MSSVIEAIQDRYAPCEIKEGKSYIKVLCESDIWFVHSETGDIYPPRKNNPSRAGSKSIGNILAPVESVEPVEAEVIEAEAIEVIEPETPEAEENAITAEEAWFLLNNDELRTMSQATLRDLSERLGMEWKDGTRAKTNAELLGQCKAGLVAIATDHKPEAPKTVEASADIAPAPVPEPVQGEAEESSEESIQDAPEKPKKAKKQASPKTPKAPSKSKAIDLDADLLERFTAPDAAKDGKSFLMMAIQIFQAQSEQNATTKAVAEAVGKSGTFLTRLSRALTLYATNDEVRELVDGGLSYWPIHVWVERKDSFPERFQEYKVKQQAKAQKQAQKQAS